MCPLSALEQAWNRSRSTVKAIRRAIGHVQLPPCVRSVVVSGSLGRMEYTCHSDVDLFIVVESTTDRATGSDARRAVWDALSPLDLKLPLADGIFSTPIDESLLTSGDALGEIDESKAVFGIRMQLLLDSQPVYGDQEYERLVEQILERYEPNHTVDARLERIAG